MPKNPEHRVISAPSLSPDEPGDSPLPRCSGRRLPSSGLRKVCVPGDSPSDARSSARSLAVGEAISISSRSAPSSVSPSSAPPSPDPPPLRSLPSRSGRPSVSFLTQWAFVGW